MDNKTDSVANFNLQYPISQSLNAQQLYWLNYQPFSFQPYFCTYPNQTTKISPTFLTYGSPQFLNTEMMNSYSIEHSCYPCISKSNAVQIESSLGQIHLQTNNEKCMRSSNQNCLELTGALSMFDANAENNSLNQSLIIENDKQNGKDIKNKFQQGIQQDYKKIIHKLRYQSKNIETNIVNKVYIYLKATLKPGSMSLQRKIISKDKAINYLKVLQKLQKAKKNIINRQHLKSLISSNKKSPGCSRIAMDLQKKGQSIQQFEYYIRVVLRNYLGSNARNSVLTSKKMNPFLWCEHLKKIRELEDYLFPNVQNKQKQIISTTQQ